MADKGQKTEQPTQRRMTKAREEGRFPTARVFVSALQFLTFVSMLRAWGLDWILDFRRAIATILLHGLSPRLTPLEVIGFSLDLLRRMLTPVLIMGAVMLGITVAVQLGVTRMGVSL